MRDPNGRKTDGTAARNAAELAAEAAVSPVGVSGG
jgi:hypothetical protein